MMLIMMMMIDKQADRQTIAPTRPALCQVPGMQRWVNMLSPASETDKQAIN